MPEMNTLSVLKTSFHILHELKPTLTPTVAAPNVKALILRLELFYGSSCLAADTCSLLILPVATEFRQCLLNVFC